jgi:ribosomal protein S18 acetylase RimI-like enzyme
VTAAFSVRRAKPEDSLLLSRLGAETFLHSFGPDNTPEDIQLYLQKSFSPEIQARELAERTSVFLIAELASEPVGYARLLESHPPPGVAGSRPIEIVRIYASPEWIGRRVGATLMQACLHEATMRQCDTIWLGVWERNQRAIAFYGKWGFAPVGSHAFLLGTDLQTDVLMARLVPALGAA